MTTPFREPKFLNESGAKRGKWYMNRVEYFQFHQYPEYKKHKFLSLLCALLCFCLSLYHANISFFLTVLFFFLSYVAFKTFYILHTKICRYKGYFLFPKKFVNFLREREVEVDLNDFDSTATMSKK